MEGGREEGREVLLVSQAPAPTPTVAQALVPTPTVSQAIARTPTVSQVSAPSLTVSQAPSTTPTPRRQSWRWHVMFPRALLEKPTRPDRRQSRPGP